MPTIDIPNLVHETKVESCMMLNTSCEGAPCVDDSLRIAISIDRRVQGYLLLFVFREDRVVQSPYLRGSIATAARIEPTEPKLFDEAGLMRCAKTVQVSTRPRQPRASEVE